jgi:hypothetical protein
MQEAVTGKREAAENYLLGHLSSAPDAAGLPATPWRLLQVSGLAPTPSLHPLLPAAWSKEELVKVNPLLSPGAVDRLHQGLLTWLQLCVLEDRLERLQQALTRQAAGVDCTAELIKVGTAVHLDLYEIAECHITCHLHATSSVYTAANQLGTQSALTCLAA